MAFSEKLKKEVRLKSDGRCVICRKPFVEIHHIIPQAEGGSDEFDNAAPLCAYCHDVYGNNPTKRKQLKEMRDSWYKTVEVSRSPKIIEKYQVLEKIKVLPLAKDTNEKKIAIYHVIYKHEDFKDAANSLICLTREAQKKDPNGKRCLFLDIEGHRLNDGAFDHDMWELQFNFILQNLMYYYSEVHLPIITIKNPQEQINEFLPDEFIILDEDETPLELKGYEGTLLTGKMSEETLKDYKNISNKNKKHRVSSYV